MNNTFFDIMDHLFKTKIEIWNTIEIYLLIIEKIILKLKKIIKFLSLNFEILFFATHDPIKTFTVLKLHTKIEKSSGENND